MVIGMDDIIKILTGTTPQFTKLQDINNDGNGMQADDIKILLAQISAKTALLK